MRGCRALIVCVILLAGLPLEPLSAVATCHALPAGVLCQAATVLPQAAEGGSKFGDVIAHLTELGNEAFKAVTALIDHKPLAS